MRGGLSDSIGAVFLIKGVTPIGVFFVPVAFAGSLRKSNLR